MFYIMSASCLFNNRSATVEDIRNEWKGHEQLVVVCQREISLDRYAKVFVAGCGGYDDLNVGGRIRYTQDTGMGYRNAGKDLIIENIIEIAKDGTMRSKNSIGMLGEKRRVWVMK